MGSMGGMGGMAGVPPPPVAWMSQQQPAAQTAGGNDELRVRRACVECHDRKLACSVGTEPEGTRCASCLQKDLPCTRVRRKRPCAKVPPSRMSGYHMPGFGGAAIGGEKEVRKQEVRR